jgi:hypothetical protein
MISLIRMDNVHGVDTAQLTRAVAEYFDYTGSYPVDAAIAGMQHDRPAPAVVSCFPSGLLSDTACPLLRVFRPSHCAP